MQAICFDLDGTLVEFDCPYAEIVADVFETHLGKSSPELVETYNEAFFEAFGELVSNPYHDGMAAILDAAEAEDTAEPAEMVETLREREYEAVTVDEAARRSLERLAEDATLGVITNGTPDWQRGKLVHAGLDDVFEVADSDVTTGKQPADDAVVTSYEAGAHKPDPAPFELAMERLPAEEYVMVGDDYEADVEGSRAAGFVPVHFENEGLEFWAVLEAML